MSDNVGKIHCYNYGYLLAAKIKIFCCGAFTQVLYGAGYFGR
jgi:hypothetical protein